MKATKRLAAINDMSGLGRCSLCVALPIISALGIQVCPVPTAILSTQTDGYEGFSFVDMSRNIEDFKNHWQQLGLTLSCIYTGFLASPKQADSVIDFIEAFNKGSTLILVDPVLGDNGKLYSIFDKSLVICMQKLLKKADIITPNMTEACLLLGIDYRPATTENALDILPKLTQLGPQMAVITGIEDADNIGSIGYNKQSRQWNAFLNPYIPCHYPGTGDIYSSVLVGKLLSGKSFESSMACASYFAYKSILKTFEENTPAREGVLFESLIPLLFDDTDNNMLSKNGILK